MRSFAVFTHPVLFIESEFDEEIPQAVTQNYLAHAKGNVHKIVLKNADHALTRREDREAFYEKVEAWLWSTITSI